MAAYRVVGFFSILAFDLAAHALGVPPTSTSSRHKAWNGPPQPHPASGQEYSGSNHGAVQKDVPDAIVKIPIESVGNLKKGVVAAPSVVIRSLGISHRSRVVNKHSPAFLVLGERDSLDKWHGRAITNVHFNHVQAR